MLIGILQCGHFPESADKPERNYTKLYTDLLSGHGFSFKTWSVVDMEFPESVASAEGWLVSGSKHGAYEDLPFIRPLEDFICRAYAKSVPLVGICFGHQIIAQALGGRIEKFSGGWAVGRTRYDFGPETLFLNAFHQDQVVEKPARAKTVASSPNCEHAALLYEGKAWSVQPHPEFGADEIEYLLDVRSEILPEEVSRSAAAALEMPLDSRVIGDKIAAFFKGGRDG